MITAGGWIKRTWQQENPDQVLSPTNPGYWGDWERATYLEAVCADNDYEAYQAGTLSTWPGVQVQQVPSGWLMLAGVLVPDSRNPAPRPDLARMPALYTGPLADFDLARAIDNRRGHL
jgi:hypothetical protein